MTKKKGIPLLAIAFSSYIFLGMPNGLLGVAWPSIRESFGLPLDALGTLLTTVTIGYMLSSFNSGRLIARLGAAILLMISSILMAVGVLGYMVSPNWWTMVASGFLVGLGNGTVDAGLNTYVAENYQARHMNWLHAFFGIGVTFGPMIMTAMLNAGLSWRWGYVVVLVLEAVLAVVYWFTRHRWTSNSSNAVEPDTGTIVVKARSLDSLRLAPVWLGIALFVMHPGIEFVAGQWSYTLFTEGRSVLPTVASLWLSIYWASLTVGRLILGSVADRIGVDNLLRWCMGGILVGSALIWWNVSDLVNFLGLALTGFGVAPLFPSMISKTPEWMGAAHAANAIGFQVAAASVGIAVLPGLTGILAERMGLEVVGPFMVVATIVMMLLFEVLVRRGSRRQRMSNNS